MTKIHKKTKQNEEAVKVSTSRIAVNGSEVEVDGKSVHEENLQQINVELLIQDIAEVKLDKMKKMEDFSIHKEFEGVEGDTNEV